MNDIELQISQFIDNELSDEAQKKLFEVLTEDKSARQILSDFMQLKKGISKHYSSITDDLLPISYHPAQTKRNIEPAKKYKTMFYFSSSAAVVLAMLLFISRNERQNDFIQLTYLQKQYTSLKIENAQINSQKETKKEIQKEVSLTRTTNKSKKIKSDKTFLTANFQTRGNANRLNRLAQISQMIEANKAVITKDDFIGGQIVGN
jgi:hypothetical protein